MSFTLSIVVSNGFKELENQKIEEQKFFKSVAKFKAQDAIEFPLGVLYEKFWILQVVLPGRKFKACYPGGSSCALLTAKDIDISMDFETLMARDTALGTASIIVMDDSADMVKVATRLMQFYQNESCGKCTPCREGTRWLVQMLERIERFEGTVADLKTIEEVCVSMAANSFCPLAVGAAPPVVSAMKEFRNEFEAYIEKNPNANEKQKMRIAYPYI